MSTPVSASSTPDSRSETVSGFAISLAFWICLIVSALLFATVALSPKLQVYLRLRNQFDTNQLRLVELERHVVQLRRIIAAIDNDKDFASELTRIEFDAFRPGEEVIPVEVSLKMDARVLQTQLTTTAVATVWYAPLVNWLANDTSVRRSFLATAALLIVASFAMLQPAGVHQVSSGVRSIHVIWQSLRNRYLQRPQ